MCNSVGHEIDGERMKKLHSLMTPTLLSEVQGTYMLMHTDVELFERRNFDVIEKTAALK